MFMAARASRARKRPPSSAGGASGRGPLRGLWVLTGYDNPMPIGLAAP